MRRILVTGALGQIGSELTLSLRRTFGDEEVLATDIRDEPTELLSGGAYRRIDVTDREAVASVVREHRAFAVFHMAAILSASGERKPDLCWSVNVGGTTNVLEAARAHGVERVIIPSSIAVFGPETPKDATPQETVTRPRTMYGITKITTELLGSYYARTHGLDVRGLRYPGIISSETPPGGGTTDYAVDMFHAAVRGETYHCFVSEETTLPMMYMPDAIRALAELSRVELSKLTYHTSYNLAAISFSAGELAREITKHVPEFQCVFEPDHRDAIAGTWPRSIDDSAARRDWGWQHEFDLASMTADMVRRLAR